MKEGKWKSGKIGSEDEDKGFFHTGIELIREKTALGLERGREFIASGLPSQPKIEP